MVLGNYITLVQGVPKRIHITAWHFEARDITDRVTGLPTKRNALVMEVDLEDGQPVIKQFSTLADKLATFLMPDLESGVFPLFDYEVVQVGTAFQTRFQVTKTPH